MALLTGLGFSEVMAQKALFVASGTHTEALAWLIHHQHHPNVDVPWNSTQLQEQVALRNTRRVLCGVDVDPSTQPLIPGHLNVAVSIVRHVEALGRRAWMVATRGFGALGMPEIVFLLKWETDVSWRARVCVCLCVCVYVYENNAHSFALELTLKHTRTHAHTHTHTLSLSPSLPLFLCSAPPRGCAMSQETEVPQCILQLLKKLFRRAQRQQFRCEHGAVVQLSLDTSTFLNNPQITGVMLTREMGQTLQGLPVPHGRFVLGLLLFGHELEWAQYLPVRLLLQCVTQTMRMLLLCRCVVTHTQAHRHTHTQAHRLGCAHPHTHAKNTHTHTHTHTRSLSLSVANNVRDCVIARLCDCKGSAEATAGIIRFHSSTAVPATLSSESRCGMELSTLRRR